MRVLLIEDDSAIARRIELMLGKEGFNVYTTDLGEEGIDLGKLYDYDIIILDLNLPDMHVYDVLKKLRASKIGTPILILSGMGEPDKKVKGLGFGADDYLVKPFDRQELVARIHAIVRRSKGHAENVINVGKLVVNLDSKSVEAEGRRLHLTGKEYSMLELLALRKGSTLTKEMFLNHLYGGNGRAGTQDHRRVHLQAAQEAGPGDRRRQLYRDGLGPRLRAARSRCAVQRRAAAAGQARPRRRPRGALNQQNCAGPAGAPNEKARFYRAFSVSAVRRLRQAAMA
jgi:two-component system cell cycle response regulator CtrA